MLEATAEESGLNPLALTFALGCCFYFSLSATRVALALFALELGGGPQEVGVLLAFYFLLPLILSWPVGALADRFGTRGLLMVPAVAGAAGMLLPYLLPSVPALYIASLLCGLSLAFYNVLLQNLVGLLSGPEGRTRAFSNLSLVGSTSNFVGPLVTGLAIDYAGGHAIACLLLVLPFVTAAGLLVRFGRSLPGGSGEAVAAGAMLSALRQRGIWNMLTTSALVQFGMDLFQFYTPVYGHSLGLSASAIGAVMACFAVAAFLVRWVLPLLVPVLTEPRLLQCCFVLSASALALIPLMASGPGLAATAFLFGLGIGGGQPLTMLLMFSRSTKGRSGEALGLRLTTNNVIRVIGPPVFGAIGAAFGAAPVYLLAGAMLGVGAWLSRGLRQSGSR